MPFDLTSKQKLIEKLLVTKQKAYDLEILLFLKRMKEDADKAEKKAGILSEQIDTLMAEEMIEWLGDSAKIIKKVEQANNSIKASIEKIEKDTHVLKEAVKALGFIDKVIEWAKSLLKP